MIVLGAGWAVAAVQNTALPRSPFSAGKTWAKERQSILGKAQMLSSIARGPGLV